jgi:hypothetical protein
MTWLRIEPGILEHPRFAGISDRALRLWLEAVTYCARNLSDGCVPNARAMLPQCKRKLRLDPVAELEQRGIVSMRKNGSMMVHDYLDYNPSKQQVLAERAKRNERVQRWRDRHGNAVGNAVTPDSVTPLVTPPPTRPDPISVGTESSSGSSTTNSPSAPRKRDAIWDGFAEWLGRQPDTRSERGAWNSAAKELRDIGVTDPADIVNRGRAYERSYPTITWTPNGLVKHWSELNGTATRPAEEAPPETCDYGEGVVCGRCGAIHGPLTVS